MHLLTQECFFKSSHHYFPTDRECWQPTQAFFIFGGTSASQPLIRVLPDLLLRYGFAPYMAYPISDYLMRLPIPPRNNFAYDNDFLPCLSKRIANLGIEPSHLNDVPTFGNQYLGGYKCL